MISASHNPAEFNGIKIFNEDGFKLADEIEERIESIVLDGTPKLKFADSENIGRVTYATNAIDDYVEHITSSSICSLDGMEIAIDCANGSASVSARKLFEVLGAKIHVLSDTPDGTNINNGCGSTHLEALRDYVLEHKLCAGVAFDGDADRCLCIDDLGNVIDGDFIMAICALDMMERGKLRRNTVVGTIMTNFGFTKFCEKNDIRFIATKVGDRYVLEEMLQEGYSLGGEQSGHVIFRDFATTGDGQLTAVQLLTHLKRSKMKLSELASVMTRYPQYIVNIRTTDEGKLAFYTDSDIKAILKDAEDKLAETGRIVVRPSGTEPLIRVMTEGEDNELTERIAKDTAAAISEKLSSY